MLGVSCRRWLPHNRGFASKVIFCALCAWLATTALAQTPLRRNVLILNEFGPGYPGTALVTEQIMSRLTGDPRYQAEFYVESVDSPLFSPEVPQQDVEDGIIEKYSDRDIDVIVANGPAPLGLLLHHPRFLSDVPVVFCGSVRTQAGNPELTSRFTGTWMSFDPVKTVEAAIHLTPDTRHVVVVGGSSQFDKAVLAITKTRLEAQPLSVDLTYFTDLDIDTVLDRLRNLPKGTAVLYISFFRDARSRQFVNAISALPMISKASSVPVFGISDTYLGHGIVGGYVVSFSDQARTAAQLVAEIFEGRKAADIPIVAGPSVYAFDLKQLNRWHLSETRLPAGSIVINRDPTSWEKAKWTFLLALSTVLGLLALAAYLLHERKQLNAAREEQARLSGRLISAQEEERSRLASELHDDFSQRLAVLSLGLETAADMIPGSPEEANRQLHELMNSAGEIGADLHTLSHRLHSSTLERLGLASGVSAFCKEFAAQQGTQIECSYDDVPRAVSPDVALCLFRIVQEGLRNVKKHSEATHAQVRLKKLEGDLHLSISDNGKGFDLNGASEGQGLGLWSMKERVRLIEGRFEIHSEVHNGTRIEVWAPLKDKSDASPSEQGGKPSYTFVEG